MTLNSNDLNMLTGKQNIRKRLAAATAMTIAVMAAALLPSCSADTPQTPDTATDKTCEVTLKLNVASFGMSDGTGTRALVVGNNDENLIKNIWIFQYNADTGKSLMDPKYVAEPSTSGNEDIELTNEVLLTLNGPNDKSLVCVVANAGRYKDEKEGSDNQWAIDAEGKIRKEFDTYEKLLSQAIPSEASKSFISETIGAIEGGNTIPMFGVSKAMAIASKCYVSIPMMRMFSKMEITVNPLFYQGTGITVENIVINNIPGYCRVSSLSDGTDNNPATYPDGTQWKPYEADNNSNVIIYFPENIQGKVKGMTSKLAAERTLFPNNALNINVKATKDGKEHTFTVYPGLDMVNDFNIRRNHIYNVNIKITKFPE